MEVVVRVDHFDWVFRKLATLILSLMYYVFLPICNAHDTVFGEVLARGILWSYGIRRIVVHGQPQSNVYDPQSGLLQFLDRLVLRIIQHDIDPPEANERRPVDIQHDIDWHNYKKLTDHRDVHVYYSPYSEDEDPITIEVIKNPENWKRYITLFTSFAFITIAIHALYRDQYLLAFLWGAVFLTSLLNHSRYTEDLIPLAIDMTTVFVTVAVTGYLVFTRARDMNLVIPLMAFMFILILFVVGWFTKTMCFHPNEDISFNAHKTLHVISLFAIHYCLFFF